MKPTPELLKSFPRLVDLEREVVAEAREWGRQRLQERLQQLAEHSGEVFPPQATAAKAAHAAQRTGPSKTGRGLWSRAADGPLGLSAAAGLGVGTASETSSWLRREALLHGDGHRVLRRGGASRQPVVRNP